MIEAFVTKLVRISRTFPLVTFLIALVFCGGLGVYAAQNLGMTTDTSELFDKNLPFRKADDAYYALFPGESEIILVVVDAKTSLAAANAADKLAADLRRYPQLIKTVRQPDGGEFFKRNGLLYLSVDQLQELSAKLAAAQPLLATLSADPSLRGFFALARRGLEGAKAGESLTKDLAPAFDEVATVLNQTMDGKKTQFDWTRLIDIGSAGTTPRALLIVEPRLDFTKVGAGEDASGLIRSRAAALFLTPDAGIRVRLTGPTPLQDEEFATVKDGAKLSGIVSVILVLVLLWLAVKTPKHVVAILLVLAMGLVATAGWATLSVGRLNVISIAFAVMFMGIAVDFGIQFCLRYRDERVKASTPGEALDTAARKIARAEAISTGAIALGFFSFLPTDYKGVAELGVIAGGGIIIGFLLTITALPALFMLLKPPGQEEPPGYLWAQKPNAWILRHRRSVLIATGGLALLSLALLPRLNFDFDPLKLKDPSTESMATLLDLLGDPWATPNTLSLLEPTLAQADIRAAQLKKLPEVRDVLTLSSFVPGQQDEKLFLIEDMAFLLEPTLQPATLKPAPSIADIRSEAQAFIKMAHDYQTSTSSSSSGALKASTAHLLAAVMRLEQELTKPTGSSLAHQANAALISGFPDVQGRLAASLQASPITVQSLPNDVKRSWIASDGRYRIQVYPSGDMRAQGQLERFTKAVRVQAPDIVGPPVIIVETGRVVMGAFAEAAALALVVIGLFLFMILRNVADVLRTIAPMLLAALLTLGTCAAIDLPLTFANVIGLPLLIGIGVSYPIYLVALWRTGDVQLLSSAVARAVTFSALTTSAAFGSLAISSHPGTSGLGILLTLALVYTLAATVIFLPALLGPPKN